MRSPWIDLLFLHHHVTPGKLAWKPDAPACDRQPKADARVEVDVRRLPLPAGSDDDSTCCA